MFSAAEAVAEAEAMAEAEAEADAATEFEAASLLNAPMPCVQRPVRLLSLLSQSKCGRMHQHRTVKPFGCICFSKIKNTLTVSVFVCIYFVRQNIRSR